MNHKQIKKHNIQNFRSAIYHKCIFNMVCAGVSECECMPFPSRPERCHLIYPLFLNKYLKWATLMFDLGF